MATVTLNPIFISISGRIGCIVFYKRKNKFCIRSYVIPRNPDTKAQKITRTRFALAVKSWQDLPDEEKYKFNRKAANLNMSGYNLYISEYLRERKHSGLKQGIKQAAIKDHFLTAQRRIPSVSYSRMPVSGKMITFALVPNGT